MNKRSVYVLMALALPALVVGGIILLVIILFAAAAQPTGWIFGGAEPNHTPDAHRPPGGAPNLWTPTPIPPPCFVTPSPVAVTATPASVPTPEPGETPGPTPTGETLYLPTPTPCPLEFMATPNPGYPPVGAGNQGYFDIRQGRIGLAKVQGILSHYPQYPLGANGLPVPGSSATGPNPLTEVAQNVVDFQTRYGINGGFALAFFVQESGLCTTGISPSAIECGNILWTASGKCVTHNIVGNHDFCGYASWSDAVEAWFILMAGYYLPNGLTTVAAIVNTYAPCSDNGGCDFVNTYIGNVDTLVTQWGVAQIDTSDLANTSPHGTPFRTGRNGYWVTQDYGCTDFPEFRDQQCASATGGTKPWFHRGIDIVSKSDPTVIATISGVVTFAGWGDDGFGNRVYVKQGPYLVIYPHLSRVLVGSGAQVQWGQPIGVQGSTGYSTGDHLHYEIHVNGAWIDPVPYLQKP